jgi:hypothetical protein
MAVLCFLGAHVAADEACPPPSSWAAPELKSKVSYDSKKRLYKYEYTVLNGSEAKSSLDLFGLYLRESPVSSEAPSKWSAEFSNPGHTIPFFQWDTHVIDPAIADQPFNGTYPDHIYALKPGRSLTGFVMTSARVPGIVQYFAEGVTHPPVVVATDKNPEPEVNCEGWTPIRLEYKLKLRV